MAIYELRTYTFQPGKRVEGFDLYQSQGWPALSKYAKHLVGYFTSDVGALNQVVHLWRFEDDAERRAFWTALNTDAEVMAFAAKLRPLLQSQRNKLLLSAPWGPRP
jgi:hypothetical protein